jgi:hypothetical protein
VSIFLKVFGCLSIVRAYLRALPQVVDLKLETRIRFMM